MTQKLKLTFMLAAVFAISACTSIPTGPGMLALPGTGKSFNQFRFDEADCRRYGSAQVGGRTANEAAADSSVKSAVVGTAVGATAGALLGGHSGTGVGAGSGLLIGSMVGAGTGDSSGYNLQQRYDFAYIQCMYAKGHRVPVSGTLEDSRQPIGKKIPATSPAPRAISTVPSASTFLPPPPPRGTPPLPPPDVPRTPDVSITPDVPRTPDIPRTPNVPTTPVTPEDILQFMPREDILPITTPDETTPTMPAEDLQPPMHPSGNSRPPPDA